MEDKRSIYSSFIVAAIALWLVAGVFNFLSESSLNYWSIILLPKATLAVLLVSYAAFFFFIKKFLKIQETEAAKDELIKKNEEIINYAIKGSGLIMWDWNFELDVLKYDRHFVEELGLDLKKPYLNYNMWMSIIYEEDRKHVARELDKHLRNKTPQFRTECRMLLSYDRTIWVAIKGKVIERNERGKPVRAIGVISDISQRKLAVLRLKSSEDRLKAIFNNVSVGIMLVDRFGHIVQVNERITEMMGYTSTELQKMTLKDITYHEDLDLTEDNIRNVYEGKYDRYHIIKRYQTKSKKIIWADLSVTSIKRLDGVTELLIGIIIDITDQKLAEEKLKLNEERLKLSLESANEGIWDVNLITGRMYISPRYYTMLGYEPYEFEPTVENIYGIYHPEDRDRFNNRFSSIEPSHDDYFEMELRLKTKTSDWKWVLLKGKIIEWTKSGKPSRMVGTNIDISNLKGIEEALRKSESRLRLVVQNMPVLMNATDHNNTFMVWNRECEQVTGYSSNEIIHNPDAFKMLYPDPDYRKQVVSKFYQKKNNFRDEEVITTCKDGSQKIILWSNISSLFPISGWASWSVGIDITDRKMAEEKINYERAMLAERVAERTAELHMLNQDLQRALKAKDEFLSTMSHELRTPLNAILGFSEALQEFTFGDLNERQLKALKTIEESGRRLLSLINDILDFSKMETDKLLLNLDEVPIELIVESSLSFVKEMALNKSIDINYELDKELKFIYADQLRIKQVFVNLLTNAVKFSPDNGKVELKIKKNNGSAQIMVKDQGIGIDKDKISEIFKPFVQLDGSFSKRHYGTGLGLALVKKIAEKHKGTVEVESEKGKGSTFIISLPQDEDTKKQLIKENTKKPIPDLDAEAK